MPTLEDLKNDMANLIERWRALENCEIDYEELVQCEKERVEERIGDIIYWYDWDDVDELKDMLPKVICWR